MVKCNKRNRGKIWEKPGCLRWLVLAVGLIFHQGLGQDMQQVEGELTAELDGKKATISIFRSGSEVPLLVQNAREGVRPYIHPIVAPDGDGVLTEYRPKHHLHQTGLYWGLKLVNGRDYFMNWEEEYWQKVSAQVLEANGREVRWQTVYHLLDENGRPVLTETQTWSMEDKEGKYVLDLEWKGEAKTEVTMGEFYVGGLFLRMPWTQETTGEVINAEGQRNAEAEGQRATWTDVGMQVEGRDDMAHIAMMDHPANRAFPTPWRVDNELGVGPSIQILGDWKIPENGSELIRYRLLVYTGAIDPAELTREWKEFAGEN